VTRKLVRQNGAAGKRAGDRSRICQPFVGCSDDPYPLTIA
jgi:hypothetical protein